VVLGGLLVGIHSIHHPTAEQMAVFALGKLSDTAAEAGGGAARWL
jgi:hypothetical protein